MENPLPDEAETNKIMADFCRCCNAARELVAQYLDIVADTKENFTTQSIVDIDLDEIQYFLTDVLDLFSDLSDRWVPLQGGLESFHRHWNYIAPREAKKTADDESEDTEIPPF